MKIEPKKEEAAGPATTTAATNDPTLNIAAFPPPAISEQPPDAPRIGGSAPGTAPAASKYPSWMMEMLAALDIAPETAEILQFRHVRGRELAAIVGTSLPPEIDYGFAVPFLEVDKGTALLTPDGRPFEHVVLRYPADLHNGAPPVKSLLPTGCGSHIYELPEVREYYAFHADVPVLLAGDEISAIVALVHAGDDVIGLPGPRMWGTKDADGSKRLLPGLECYCRDREVVIIHDSNAGHDPALDSSDRALAAAIAKVNGKLFRVVLPRGKEGQDVTLVDFLLGGGHLKSLVKKQRKPVDLRPLLSLPGGRTEYCTVGRKLGELLAGAGGVYVFNSLIVTISTDGNGRPVFSEVQGIVLCSQIERVAATGRYRASKTKDKAAGALVFQPERLSEQTARVLLASTELKMALPVVLALSSCAFLHEGPDGRLRQVAAGYDPQSGVLASGTVVEIIDLAEAMNRIDEILKHFRFATPADRTRAYAAIITPLLVISGLLGGRPPVFVYEADLSQAGKGYLAALVAAIYRQIMYAVTQRKGVGSLEEMFSAGLLAGYLFVCLDNLRGRIDSQAIESALTEATFTARVPHGGNVVVSMTRVCLAVTSNAAEFTPDFANRGAFVRILKHEPGYPFPDYPEGDLLAHVRANPEYYLAAVAAIVMEWHRRGKPRLATTTHDFRAWGRTLGWIVENLLGLPPLMEGHIEARTRVINPHLTWLRLVAIAILGDGIGNQWIRANRILDVIHAGGLEIPGTEAGSDPSGEGPVRNAALTGIGRKMRQCFGPDANNAITIDGMVIERREVVCSAERRAVREYRTTATPRVQAAADPDLGPYCAYGAPMDGNGIGATQNALSAKTLGMPQDGICAHAPIDPVFHRREDTVEDSDQDSSPLCGISPGPGAPGADGSPIGAPGAVMGAAVTPMRATVVPGTGGASTGPSPSPPRPSRFRPGSSPESRRRAAEAAALSRVVVLDASMPLPAPRNTATVTPKVAPAHASTTETSDGELF